MWPLQGLVLALVSINAVSADKPFKFEEVLIRKDVVWGIDFLPDGRFIFTERAGKMGIYDEAKKKLIELKGPPRVHAEGQGGLLDVKVHPDFARNKLVYFTYSLPQGKDLATTALARGTLEGEELKNLKNIFVAQASNNEDHHFGSRIVFDGKGHIFLTVGDRGEQDKAQRLDNHHGKVIRLREDGSVPKDNPFVGQKGALPEIWSYGHRNPQGLAIHPESGALYEVEFGPLGGDEVNLVEKGKNYGWPVITYGREYTGFKVGDGLTEKGGMEQPLKYWVPSISPSGANFYSGDKFPGWKNDLFLADLSAEDVRRVTFKDGKFSAEESFLKERGSRFRQVRQSPQGHLYLTTDEGVIGRLVPVK